MSRLGLLLVVTVGAALMSGVPYVSARLGLGSGVDLARVDGPHIYLGVVAALLLAAKSGRLRALRGAGQRVRALPWQRWLSRAMMLGYAGVLLTGLLLLPAWPAPVRTELVNLHLLTAAWSGIATIPHVFTWVRRHRPGVGLDLRIGSAAAVLVAPVMLLAAVPAAASPGAVLEAGAAWQPVGGGAARFFHVAVLPDGSLLATGIGAEFSRDGGAHWTGVPGLAGKLVLAAAVAPGGRVYAATPDGVLAAAAIDRAYLPTPLTTSSVKSLYADGRDVWAGGAGLWMSSDAGATWTPRTAGLVQQGFVWSLRNFRGDLYAGTSTGVYRLYGTIWSPVLAVPRIASLDVVGGDLWASSMSSGLHVLRGGVWRAASDGLSAHNHGRTLGVHIAGVAGAPGRLVATTMAGAVVQSLDGGRTWYSVSPGLSIPALGPVAVAGTRAVVGTDRGVLTANLAPPPAPTWTWWTLLSIAALAVLAVAIRIEAGGFTYLAPRASALVASVPAADPDLRRKHR